MSKHHRMLLLRPCWTPLGNTAVSSRRPPLPPLLLLMLVVQTHYKLCCLLPAQMSELICLVMSQMLFSL